MNKFATIIFLLLLVLFATGCISSDLVNADAQNQSQSQSDQKTENTSTYSIVSKYFQVFDNPEIQEQYNQRVESTPSTDVNFFKNLETDSATVAIFGAVPSLEGRVAYSWTQSLHSIGKTIQKDENFTNYMEEHDGPLAGYMTNDYVFIFVAPEKRNELTEEDIEKIMIIINGAAEDQGIENLPVVFHASRLEVYAVPYLLE
jgi:hypothetical protein